MRKNICLVTNWYPTKENPYAGAFFKEQAIAMEKYFDYTVIHYHESMKDLLLPYCLRVLFKADYSLSVINTERNTTEYDLTVHYPLILKVCDLIKALYGKVRHTPTKHGVGKRVSECRKRSVKRALTKIFQRHFAEKLDILYCVDAQAESADLKWISEALNIPYVVSEHAPVPWPGSVLSDINHEAIEAADAFLAISNDKIRQVMLQNIRPKKIFYVGNMINEAQFRYCPRESREKVFIIVAAHSFYKNYDYFVEVMERLTEIASQAFKVLIVGYAANKGYSEDTEAFEQQIRQSKFADKAVMIRESAHSLIQTYYNQADAFVMTSIQEGQPVSAMEAACCGLPIFSTRCGGVEDYVTEEIGRLFPLNDAEFFAQTLNSFLKGELTFDPQRIRETVISRYGKKAFIENFKKVVDEVLTDAEN